MSGYQFVHIQTYARKASKGGRSVSGVLAEASRQPEACTHVAEPRPPVVVHGCTLDVVRARHDAAVQAGRSQVTGGKARAVRTDQHSLLTVVASHPALSDQVSTDPLLAVEVDVWQARVVEWMKAQWGDRLVSVVRHTDEAHPHLHAYVVPDAEDVKAKNLHPGCVAKDLAKAAALASGSDAKAANTVGDAAYKAAMRGMQDGFFESVGLPSGMSRIGPGRRRLTRVEWQAEQTQARATGIAIAAAELARAEASDATGAAAEIHRAAEARATQLAAQGQAYVVKAREVAAAAKAAADAAGERAAQAQQAEVEARRRAAQVVQAARRHAVGLVHAAEARAARVTRLGGLLGAGWLGLSGIRARVEAHAARQVEQARAQGQAGVAGALDAARVEVGGELRELRADAAMHRVEAERAQLQVAETTAKLASEHSARMVAEREREDFRARWADADNKLIALGRDRRL